MVWYVRLLSQPKLSLRPPKAQPVPYSPVGYQRRTILVTCPINLTTDLSDAYYPGPAVLGIQAFDVSDDGLDYALAPVQNLEWKGAAANTLVVKANIGIPVMIHNDQILRVHDGNTTLVKRIVLRVTAFAGRYYPNPEPSTLEPESVDATVDVLEFLDVWTAPYFVRLENGVHHFEIHESLWLERRLQFKGFWEPESEAADANAADQLGSAKRQPNHSCLKQDHQPELRLWEDAGESMARHVWDGGLALATHFARVLQTDSGSVLSTLLYPGTTSGTRLGPAPSLRILELGAGVGTSGLALANFLPNSHTHIVLTDLPDAQPILQSNIASYMQHGRAPTSTHAVVQQTHLDWYEVSANASEEMKRLAALLTGSDDEEQLKPSAHRRRGRPPKKSKADSEAEIASSTPSKPVSPWDLVVVSDCTYNEDTLGLLVTTLAAVTGKGNSGNGEGDVAMGEVHTPDVHATKDKQGAQRAKKAKVAKEAKNAQVEKGNDTTTTATGSAIARSSPLIVLARKPRHSSEEAFFDLIAARGFTILEQSRVRLPDGSRIRYREDEDEDEEIVDVFVYC